MTERRFRIKGRLGEILSGEPKALEVGSTTPETPPGAETDELKPNASEPEAILETKIDELPGPRLEPESLSDEELERALYDEAKLGEFELEEEEPQWVLGMDWPPTPDMEMAFFEEDFMVEDAEDQETKVPVPTLEDAMDSSEIAGSTFASVPTAEVGETAMAGATEPLGAVDIQDPGVRVKRLELPLRQLGDAEKAELEEQYRSKMEEIEKQIDEVSKEVLSKVGENEDISTDCLYQLL